MRIKYKLWLFYCSLQASSYALTADLNARDFFPAPSGTNVGLVYLNYDRSTNFHGDNTQEASLRSTAVAYRNVYFTDICGTLCTPQFILPVVDLNVRPPGANGVKRQTNMGDLQFGATLYTINDPSRRLYSGLLTIIVAPTGSYKSHHPSTSIGKNRWEADFVYNITKGLTDKLYIETNFEIQFYTKNNDFNGLSYRQKPVLRNQSFISYNFTDKTYGALRFVYAEGGRSKLDGETLSDSKYRSTQVGFELGHKIAPKDTLLFTISRDVQARNTFQGNHVLMRLAHVF